MRNFRRTAGFTLIELMITIVVLAIITALTVPSFSDMIENSRRISCANQLLGALQFARSEAVRRGEQVTVDWKKGIEKGLSVYVAANSTTMLQQTAWCNGPQVNQNSNNTTFKFKPNGQTTLSTELKISICEKQKTDESGRSISVLSTGVVRSKVDTCVSEEQ